MICTDLKVSSSFQTGWACPMATLVRFTWFSHCTHQLGLCCFCNGHYAAPTMLNTVSCQQ